MKNNFYILFLISLKLSAQYNLNGFVRNQNDNTPIPNCPVILKGSDATIIQTHTDSSGAYSFKLNSNDITYEVYTQTNKDLKTPTAKCGFLASDDKGSFKTSDTIPQNYQKDFLLSQIYDCGPSIHPILFAKNSTVIIYPHRIMSAEDSLWESPIENINLMYEILKNNPTIVIGLMGHCSSNEKNVDTLSLLRAEKVKEELVKRGINQKRIECKGWGIQKLKVSNKQIRKEKIKNRDLLHEINRRVTFRINSWEFKEE